MGIRPNHSTDLDVESWVPDLIVSLVTLSMDFRLCYSFSMTSGARMGQHRASRSCIRIICERLWWISLLNALFSLLSIRRLR